MVSSLHWTVGLSRHTTDGHNQGRYVGNVAVSASFLIPLDALHIYRYFR